jgi:hypothetical protein
MEIVHADKMQWYRKPNLRFLYLILVPTCIGTEWTLGFDGSMMNNLQAVPSWLEGRFRIFPFGTGARVRGGLVDPRFRQSLEREARAAECDTLPGHGHGRPV